MSGLPTWEDGGQDLTFPQHVRRCVRDDRLPHRDRLDRAYRGPERPVLGRADPAIAASLLDRRRGRGADADGGRPRARPAQEGGRAGERRTRPARSIAGGPDRRGRRRDPRRRSRRSLPPLRLADRLRHADEHERERGHLEPGDRDGWGRARLQGAGASQRSRQHVAVLERHVPDRDARRDGDAADRSGAPLGPSAPRRARCESGRMGRHREDRPDPPAGRGPPHPRTGVLGLRRAARRRRRADRADAPPPLRARGRRHRGRHRPERSGGIRRRMRGQDRRAHRSTVRPRSQPVRGPRGRTTRSSTRAELSPRSRHR